MLEQAYENAAVPKRMRAASSLPPVLFNRFVKSAALSDQIEASLANSR